MKKRLFGFILLLCVLVSCFSFADSINYYVKTNGGGGITVRAEPRTNAKKLGKIEYGEDAHVLEIPINNDWAKIDFKGMEGYVQSRYLVNYRPGFIPTPDKEGESSEPIDYLPYVKAFVSEWKNYKAVTPYYVIARPVKGDVLNLRQVPNKLFGLIRRINDGEKLIVIGETKSWLQVIDTATGFTGYVSAKYVELSPETDNNLQTLQSVFNTFK